MPGHRHVRRAGSGRLEGGRRLTWTVADGSRGRRWRSATTSADGRLALALLVEVSPEGLVRKLEVAAPAGLLTLHPDGRTLHGNVVRSSGIEHIALPWNEADLLLAGASPVTAAIAAAGLAARVGVGEGTGAGAVEVGEDLRVRRATWRVARTGERRWRLLAADGGASLALELDTDGIPVLESAAGWPLELGPATGA
jgi:hypothetical protein